MGKCPKTLHNWSFVFLYYDCSFFLLLFFSFSLVSFKQEREVINFFCFFVSVRPHTILFYTDYKFVNFFSCMTFFLNTSVNLCILCVCVCVCVFVCNVTHTRARIVRMHACFLMYLHSDVRMSHRIMKSYKSSCTHFELRISCIQFT